MSIHLLLLCAASGRHMVQIQSVKGAVAESHHSSCENKKKNASDCSQLLHILNFFEKIRNLAENLYDGGSKLGILGFKNRQPSNRFTNVRILLKTL